MKMLKLSCDLYRLGEEKPELVEGIVTRFGKELAHKLYKLTQKTEINGGMEINVSKQYQRFFNLVLFIFSF